VIRGGARHQRDRAPEEFVTVNAPELRIVPEGLWRAAHERMDARRALYFAANKGTPSGSVRRQRLDPPTADLLRQHGSFRGRPG